MRTPPRIVVLLALTGCAATAAVASAPNITTVTGIADLAGFFGDGGPAATAGLNAPSGVAVDAGDAVLIADQDNNRVRRISPAGNITTVAGSGAFSDSGDGGPAIAAGLGMPGSVAAAASGDVLIADTYNNRIRRVGPDGRITTIAGTGGFGFSGDGGDATAAQLDRPQAVAEMPDGSVLIADTFNNRIRRIGLDGRIATVAGTGAFGLAGDGADAVDAELNLPTGVAAAPDGGFLIADQGNHLVRHVSPAGIITTIAGTSPGFSGDGGPAALAQLEGPASVAVAPDDSIVIADQDNHAVRVVAPDGTISTLAGLQHDLVIPAGVAVTSTGAVLVADAGAHTIRRIDAHLAPAATATTTSRRTSVRITRMRVTRMAGGGVRVRFRLSRAARVMLAVQRGTGVPRRISSRISRAGVVTLTWRGRLGARRASHGLYRMIVIARSGPVRTSAGIRVRI